MDLLAKSVESAGYVRREFIQDQVSWKGNLSDKLSNQRTSYETVFVQFMHTTTKHRIHCIVIPEINAFITVCASMDLSPKPYATTTTNNTNTHNENKIIITNCDSKFCSLTFTDSGALSRWQSALCSALTELLCEYACCPLASGRVSTARMGRCLATCRTLNRSDTGVIQRLQRLRTVRVQVMEMLKVISRSNRQVSAADVRSLKTVCWAAQCLYPLTRLDPDIQFILHNVHSEGLLMRDAVELRAMLVQGTRDEGRELLSIMQTASRRQKAEALRVESRDREASRDNRSNRDGDRNGWAGPYSSPYSQDNQNNQYLQGIQHLQGKKGRTGRKNPEKAVQLNKLRSPSLRSPMKTLRRPSASASVSIPSAISNTSSASSASASSTSTASISSFASTNSRANFASRSHTGLSSPPPASALSVLSRSSVSATRPRQSASAGRVGNRSILHATGTGMGTVTGMGAGMGKVVSRGTVARAGAGAGCGTGDWADEQNENAPQQRQNLPTRAGTNAAVKSIAGSDIGIGSADKKQLQSPEVVTMLPALTELQPTSAASTPDALPILSPLPPLSTLSALPTSTSPALEAVEERVALAWKTIKTHLCSLMQRKISLLSTVVFTALATWAVVASGALYPRDLHAGYYVGGVGGGVGSGVGAWLDPSPPLYASSEGDLLFEVVDPEGRVVYYTAPAPSGSASAFTPASGSASATALTQHFKSNVGGVAGAGVSAGMRSLGRVLRVILLPITLFAHAMNALEAALSSLFRIGAHGRKNAHTPHTQHILHNSKHTPRTPL
ncbi:hypothetical protein B484DRAFT_452418 [Ochromonadaceae sp. CCMP2298]|nr:hypothetical protein B484DRAFT_452418 [Ochromonadaceae sp. CCMP2298]